MKSNWYKVYNYGKTKNLKKKLREVMKPTMVNFKRKFLND